MIEIAESRTKMPAHIQQEFLDNPHNGEVGQVLLSETSRVRVWRICIQPGDRMGVHCHQLDYFWIVKGSGTARAYYSDGVVADFTYRDGDTRHFTFKPGECITHSLENIGETVLDFTIVEFKQSANAPLKISTPLI